jgi:hypothetical protein
VAPLDTWTAELLWSHSRTQQRGIARKLLHEAAKLFEQPITSFGWRRPFTPSGEALVRRVCPDGFWEPE